jgi:hypothetical protein
MGKRVLRCLSTINSRLDSQDAPLIIAAASTA